MDQVYFIFIVFFYFKLILMPDIVGWQPISSETTLIALAAKQFSKYK